MKKHHFLFSCLLIMCIGFTLSACGNNSDSGTTNENTENLLSGKHHVAINVNNYGTIELELDADTAPVLILLILLIQDSIMV